jgi:single-stranded-DNA-specific exonuclease
MHWEVNSTDLDKEIKTLSRELNICNTTASLLISRDVKSFEDARTFFRPSLDHLHDPFFNEGYGQSSKENLRGYYK